MNPQYALPTLDKKVEFVKDNVTKTKKMTYQKRKGHCF